MADDVQKVAEIQQPAASEPSPEPSSPPRGQYEFNEQENEVFASLSLSLRMGGWGIIVLLVVYHAVLLGRWAFGGPAMYDKFRLVQVWLPLVLLTTSAVLIRAGRAFARVVNTKGSDITHLMDGLKSLNEVFGWVPVAWFVFLLAIVFGGLAALVHAMGF